MSNKIITKQVRLNVSDCASYTSNFVHITMPVPPWEQFEAALSSFRKGETPAGQRLPQRGNLT